MISKVFRSALVALLVDGTAASARAALVFATWKINGGEQTAADLGARAASLQSEVGQSDVLVIRSGASSTRAR